MAYGVALLKETPFALNLASMVGRGGSHLRKYRTGYKATVVAGSTNPSRRGRMPTVILERSV
jgi:hypothetical protein